MQILIIRHGDPDYRIDGLTEKGKREAELLAERMAKMEITEFFVSPLGRAKATASYTLEKMQRTARECDWLREFPTRIYKPDRPKKSSVSWDWLPEIWMQREYFFREDRWQEAPEFQAQGVKEEYDRVVAAFDALLAEHGYVRDGRLYRTKAPNRETLAFFCHFGVACVLMSRLMNVSPMIPWQHICLAPTSVTSLYTEERREGIVQFRANAIGDTSHLYAGGEEPAFAARFCETYDSEERHD